MRATIPVTLRTLLRTTPTVAPIPNRTVLAVSGSDATQFLNGLLAVTAIQGRQSYGAFLHAQVCRSTANGRVYSMSLLNRAVFSTTSFYTRPHPRHTSSNTTAPRPSRHRC